MLHMLHLYHLKLDCLFLFTQKTAICRMLFCFTCICQSVGISFVERMIHRNDFIALRSRTCHHLQPFPFKHHAGMRQSMVDLQNAHCTSLISFEYGFIECFMCFTYIICSLDCLFLFTQKTAICRMLFCFTYICQRVGISYVERIKLSFFTYIYLER